MSKIAHLETVHRRLTFRVHFFIKRLLRPEQYDFTLTTFEEYTKTVGQATILQAEIADHCLSLRAIVAACQHGLAGTIPEGYDEYGYEFVEEPQEPLLPYDPYTDILGYLAGGTNISCLALSDNLLRFIEILPEVAAERAERNVEAKDGVLLHVGDDGSTRPMTKSELRRLGNRAVVDAVEESLFATTYAADMQRIQELAQEHGDLHQILDLLA